MNDIMTFLQTVYLYIPLSPMGMIIIALTMRIIYDIGYRAGVDGGRTRYMDRRSD